MDIWWNFPLPTDFPPQIFVGKLLWKIKKKKKRKTEFLVGWVFDVRVEVVRDRT